MSRGISINIDKVLVSLICGYAFFIPLEQILDVFFGIDTVLKPYRIFALLIIALFILRSTLRIDRNHELAEDKFLYILFFYGGVITALRMVTTTFNSKFLFNDIFQLGLYLGVFVVVRHLSLSKKQISRVLTFLALGVLTNCIYIFSNSFLLGRFGRDSGFMDNPNYLSFGIQVVIVLMVIRFANVQGFVKKVAWVAVVLFLGYIFIITGSRTGLVMLAVSFGLIMYFSSLKIKATLVLLMLCTGIFLSLKSSSDQAGSLVLVNRVNNERDSEDNRLPIWRGVLRASEATNFAGMGIGQFKGRFKEFYKDENNDLIQRIVRNDYFLSPHSDYLMLLAVYGIVGLLSYLIFCFLSVKKVFYQFIAAQEEKSRQFYQFSFLMLTSVLVFGIANENFNSALFWIILGMSTSVNLIETDEEETQYITEE